MTRKDDTCLSIRRIDNGAGIDSFIVSGVAGTAHVGCGDGRHWHIRFFGSLATIVDSHEQRFDRDSAMLWAIFQCGGVFYRLPIAIARDQSK